MISEESITQISHIFCGDTEGYYLYKTGPKLVAFFNQYFGSNDIYKSGFPSRWVYVYNKIVNFINTNSVDAFFDIILGKAYLMREQGISEVKSAELSNKILDEFNRIVSRDFCKITRTGGQHHLVRENEDLEFIGAVLECMSYYSMDTVAYEFYDVALKYQQSRDDDSMEMLDLIFDTRGVDIGSVFKIGNYDSVLHNLATAAPGTFRSAYEAAEVAAQTRIDQLNELFQKLK